MMVEVVLPFAVCHFLFYLYLNDMKRNHMNQGIWQAPGEVSQNTILFFSPGWDNSGFFFSVVFIQLWKLQTLLKSLLSLFWIRVSSL